jgi:hypothetical protein
MKYSAGAIAERIKRAQDLASRGRLAEAVETIDPISDCVMISESAHREGLLLWLEGGAPSEIDEDMLEARRRVLLSQSPWLRDKLAYDVYEVAHRVEGRGEMSLALAFFEIVAGAENASLDVRCHAFFRSGVLNERLHRYEAAVTYFHASIQLGGNSEAERLSNLHLARLSLAAEDFSEAEPRLQWLRDHPASDIPAAWVQLKLGEGWYHAGDLPRGLSTLKEVAAVFAGSRESLEANLLLASHYRARHSYEQLKACLDQILCNPTIRPAERATVGAML